MSQLALSASFEYLCYVPTAIINYAYSYSAGIDLLVKNIILSNTNYTFNLNQLFDILQT